MSITHNREQARYQVQRRRRASSSFKKNNSPSGRYYLHPKDWGKGNLAGRETIKGTFPKTPEQCTLWIR